VSVIVASGQITVGRLLATPGRGGCTYGATICWENGKVSSVSAGGRPDDVKAGKGLLALPALVNAHDHGRGLRQLAFGARDQQLELWRPALYAHPPVDPYLNAVVAFGRLARAGVGTVVHVHSSIVVHKLVSDAEAVARAANAVGIRLAFVVPLRDCRTLGYGDDQEMLARHPPADREMIRQKWLYRFPSPAEYMMLVREIARRIESPTVSVQLGPNSPQACTDALLEAIAAESADGNRRVHTHLLETATQRRWSDAQYREGIIRHLDDLQLLSPRFTGAHGVWLKPEDCRLLAERGSSIVINTSSNLRLRSGIPPVSDYIHAGMKFALGVDSSSFDDDDDAFREMRVTHWLHSLHENPAPLTPERLFDAALRNGHEVAMSSRHYGSIEPGMPADFVILDYDSMAYDVIEGMVEELDVLLTRATRNHVKHVFVNGRPIVQNGGTAGLDLAALERELLMQAHAAAPAMRALQPIMERSQETLRAFYESGGHLTLD
jgi:cytosine/adenosine deaminase-related metal-dependent hydrolase